MTWTDIALRCLYALLIVGVGHLVGSWLSGVVHLALERTRMDPGVRQLVVGLVRPAVFALAVFAALAQLGMPGVLFAAVAGALTLSLGLALNGSLSNVASGAMLLSIRPYSVDDTVTVAGHTGKVRSLQLFSTVIDTHDGRIVTLSNDLVWKAPIVTFSATPNTRIELTWVLPAHVDLARAEAEVRAAIPQVPRVLAEPAPLVLWGETTEAGLQMTARAWVPNAERELARSDLQRAVLNRLHEAKIPWASHPPTPRGR